MTSLRDAAQQALDVMSDISSFERWSEAKEALRAALAEQPTNQCGETCERAKLCAVCARELAEPVQEPVAVRWRHPQYRWTYEDYKPGQFYGPRVEVQRLYTAPPQRPPLTDEEIQDCFHAARNARLGSVVVEIARAIERAHGIGEP